MAAKQLTPRLLLAAASSLLALSQSCGAEEVHVTELVLVTDSDFPHTDLARLKLVVAEDDGPPQTLYDIAVSESTEWPATFGLVHKGSTLGTVKATIQATLRSPRQNAVLTRTHVAEFVANKTLVVPLNLSGRCFRDGDPSTFTPAQAPCENGLQCSEGEPMCVAVELGTLAAWPVPTLSKGGSIVEPAGDGGVADGGTGDGDGDGGSMPMPDGGSGTVCDGMPTDLLTDDQHCGSCTRDCTSNSGTNPNFTGACLQGVCECQDGFRDCNPNDQDQSCSTQLGTKTNCGDCGDKCTGQKVCMDGLCVMP